MPRPRQYATEAARQAAHRTRTQANADQLHCCLYQLSGQPLDVRNFYNLSEISAREISTNVDRTAT